MMVSEPRNRLPAWVEHPGKGVTNTRLVETENPGSEHSCSSPGLQKMKKDLVNAPARGQSAFRVQNKSR